MNDAADAGTSTTGAKSMSIPSARSDRPVASPSAARHPRRPHRPICGADRNGGADRSRLTIPPSWSIAISGSGTPPARAARRSRSTSDADLPPRPDVRPEQHDAADLAAAHPPQETRGRRRSRPSARTAARRRAAERAPRPCSRTAGDERQQYGERASTLLAGLPDVLERPAPRPGQVVLAEVGAGRVRRRVQLDQVLDDQAGRVEQPDPVAVAELELDRASSPSRRCIPK